jgi:hypothetical protein
MEYSIRKQRVDKSARRHSETDPGILNSRAGTV